MATILNFWTSKVDPGLTKARVDVRVDTLVDILVDTWVDTLVDVRVDTLVDVWVDTLVDIWVDTLVDVWVDTLVDVWVVTLVEIWVNLHILELNSEKPHHKSTKAPLPIKIPLNSNTSPCTWKHARTHTPKL